ncbi:MAG: TolC family protein [Candidatus Eremiobacteraeota bacterium]|nr:TolC family protein [Candidatus Eremiobacteraeota bacterium]
MIFLLLLLLIMPAFAQPEAEPDLDARIQNLLQGQSIDGQDHAIGYGQVAGLALQRNQRLAASATEPEQAVARSEQAEAARNPTLSNNYFYVHQDQNLVAQNLPNTRYVLLASGYNLAQSTLYTLGQNQMLNRTSLFIPIYTGGRLESNMHLQDHLAGAARQDLQRRRQETAFQAKQQYLQVLLARENRHVADKLLAQAQGIQTLANARLNAGVANQLEVLQAEVAVANAQDAEVKTLSTWQQAQADLAVDLDLPVLTHFQPDEELKSPDLVAQEALPGGQLKDWLSLSLQQRPELEAFRQRLLANQEEANVARADLLPQLGLALNYDVIGAPTRLAGGPSLIATLSIPLYDGGVTNAKIKEIDLHRLQIKTEELHQLEGIQLEVRQAALQVNEADQRLETAVSAQKKAAEALRIAEIRYQVGAGTSLEVVEAQASLGNAEFDLADAHFRQLQSRAQLNLALGQPLKEGN